MLEKTSMEITLQSQAEIPMVVIPSNPVFSLATQNHLKVSLATQNQSTLSLAAQTPSRVSFITPNEPLFPLFKDFQSLKWRNIDAKVKKLPTQKFENNPYQYDITREGAFNTASYNNNISVKRLEFDDHTINNANSNSGFNDNIHNVIATKTRESEELILKHGSAIYRGIARLFFYLYIFLKEYSIIGINILNIKDELNYFVLMYTIHIYVH